MNRRAPIFVAGAGTLIGAAILERLRAEGYRNFVGVPPDEPDLTQATDVETFFAETRPEYVFLAAGKSGGIYLNQTRPADLLLDNLLIATNVIPAAHRYGVTKLLYLASSCAYPKHAPQPLNVASLLSGPLEPTSEAYALGKLAGWRLCEAFRRQFGVCFITAFPANSFGPGDDFDPDSGHVIPALLRRTHEAQERGEPSLSVWGTGTPRREFIYAADLADACLFVMRHFDGAEPINLGVGADHSIAETAAAVAEVVGYHGRICFDTSKPDGAPLKRLDSSQLQAFGWRPSTDFREALAETYRCFLQHVVKEGRQHEYAAV